MPIKSFGEYRPDVSDFNGDHTRNILNVVPQGDGYGPWKELTAFSSALSTSCRGYFYGKKSDGTAQVFAGTSDKLYNMSNTTLGWVDVSTTSTAGYTALGSDANWNFAQFGKYVVAVQQNVVPQYYSMTTSTAFKDITGSPPQAAYVTVVNRFLVMSGIITPNVYRIQWSGLNDIFGWTSGTNSSDYQDLPDGGFVRGVAGGEQGYIMQESSIRRMTFAPGSPYVFGIDRITQGKGIYAPGSLIAADDRVFFIAPDGFHMIAPGAYPTPIGKERVDRTFFEDVDPTNLRLIIGAHDPKQSRVYWAYKSNNTAQLIFDSVLVYDWELDKWAKLSITGEYIATLARPGITLENLDTAFGTNIDTISLGSLDDIASSALAALSAFDTSHHLGFFSGDNLEATLETGEQGADGQRIYVNGLRPICDSADIFGSVSKRDTPQAATTYSTETAVNTETGVCPARVATRYARGKIRITAGSTWTYAAGVEPDVTLEGRR